MNDNVLQGKVAVVAGVANNASLAWQIAKPLNIAGASIALFFQDDPRIRKNVAELLGELTQDCQMFPVDVSNDTDIGEGFRFVRENFGKVDIIVHSIAFADGQYVNGRLLDIPREQFGQLMNVNVYSLIALLRGVGSLFVPGGSAMALTYEGGRRVFPRYHVMGPAKAALDHLIRILAEELGENDIRINAISSGPARTMAGRMLKGITDMVHHVEETAPLHSHHYIDTLGNLAVLLASDGGRFIMGETIHVDAGHHVLGNFPTESDPQTSPETNSFRTIGRRTE